MKGSWSLVVLVAVLVMKVMFLKEENPAEAPSLLELAMYPEAACHHVSKILLLYLMHSQSKKVFQQIQSLPGLLKKSRSFKGESLSNEEFLQLLNLLRTPPQCNLQSNLHLPRR